MKGIGAPSCVGVDAPLGGMDVDAPADGDGNNGVDVGVRTLLSTIVSSIVSTTITTSTHRFTSLAQSLHNSTSI